MSTSPLVDSSSSSTSSSPLVSISLNKSSNENLLKNTLDNTQTNDESEILTLINLLILRVECLNNEEQSNEIKNQGKKSSTVKQIDQNLIEYLYFLFNKFVNDEPESATPLINKTKFVNVCQTLVRNGSLNMSSSPSPSPDHSLSESTTTNTSDKTLMQALIREYKTDTDVTSKLTTVINGKTSSMSIIDDDSWLVVDLEQIKPQESKQFSDESKV